uniref:Ovule protein n=1 Tax=Strongyloides papillosus TaxID=174720 RepID=A0A0N5CH97_STREA
MIIEHVDATEARIRAPVDMTVYYIYISGNHETFACSTKKSSESTKNKDPIIRRIAKRSDSFVVPTKISLLSNMIKVLDSFMNTGSNMTSVSK